MWEELVVADEEGEGDDECGFEGVEGGEGDGGEGDWWE